MKIQITLLSIEEKISKSSGNAYGAAQVIFHDEKITAGPCNITGDNYQQIKEDFKPGARYEAELTLQPERSGTSVQIVSLSPIKAQATPIQSAGASK